METIMSRGNWRTGRDFNRKKAYSTWWQMRNRCFNKSFAGYKNYGARGITVCERWRTSFDKFYEDMGKPPTPQHQIDRINNDGNYDPGNCRWITPEANCSNRSNNIWLTTMGKSKTIEQWARHSGIASSTIFSRLKRGWKISDAITKPPCELNQKGTSHLNELKVRIIRRVYEMGSELEVSQGKISMNFLAQIFHVDRGTIKSVLRRETWRHVQFFPLPFKKEE